MKIKKKQSVNTLSKDGLTNEHRTFYLNIRYSLAIRANFKKILLFYLWETCKFSDLQMIITFLIDIQNKGKRIISSN